jgi:uncharacterized protein
MPGAACFDKGFKPTIAEGSELTNGAGSWYHFDSSLIAGAFASEDLNMPVRVNLRHLEAKNVHLEGEVSPGELEFSKPDEMAQPNHPLQYDLEVEKNGLNLLVHGELHTTLDCQCVRCLRPFKYPIDLDPYDLLIPLEGEDKAVISNDLVDLTPYLREDILLAFPQHPLCEADCNRVPELKTFQSSSTSVQGQKSAWDELNKLKLK